VQSWLRMRHVAAQTRFPLHRGGGSQDALREAVAVAQNVMVLLWAEVEEECLTSALLWAEVEEVAPLVHRLSLHA
jgi:hypothetical protein